MPIIRDIVTLILIQGTLAPNPRNLKPPTIQLHVVTIARKESTKVNTFATTYSLEESLESLLKSMKDHITNLRALEIIFTVQTSNLQSLKTPKPPNYLPSNLIQLSL
jgi:hypothetical protein